MEILNTKEQGFLKIINETLTQKSHLGDDCAILEKFNLAITQDTLVEDVHFDLRYITPNELGQKAVLVNLSDVIASGAKPNYITISISGRLDDNFIREFYLGVNEICTQFDVEVVGGDITSGEKLTISICATGDTKNRNISSRKNAKEGYIIAVCGDFGTSACGFSMLKIGKNEFTKAHKKPTLFPEISDAIATKTIQPYAMMDSSDGLLDCLAQISRASGVGMLIEYDKIPKRVNDKNMVLFGGEDYSLVICINEKDFNKIEGLKKIGVVIGQKGIFVDTDNYSNKVWGGYNHFE